MITTDAYPELDEAHAEALLDAANQVISDSFADLARLNLVNIETKGRALHGIKMFDFLPAQFRSLYDLRFRPAFRSHA